MYCQGLFSGEVLSGHLPGCQESKSWGLPPGPSHSPARHSPWLLLEFTWCSLWESGLLLSHAGGILPAWPLTNYPLFSVQLKKWCGGYFSRKWWEICVDGISQQNAFFQFQVHGNIMSSSLATSLREHGCMRSGCESTKDVNSTISWWQRLLSKPTTLKNRRCVQSEMTTVYFTSGVRG